MKNHVKVLIAVVLVILLIGTGLYRYSYPFGFKGEVDRTVDAVAILEDGRSLPCTVRFLGELSMDRIAQFHGRWDDGGIFINDCIILADFVFIHADQNGILEDQYYLNRDLTVFVAKVDASEIFPDMESQTVYVVLKSNTPEEYGPILDILKNK